MMKSTETFKSTIQQYLENRALNDSLFAAVYAKEGKNLDDCITYILNTVQQSGCCGFDDKEIYSMAVHYYDEDIIEIGKVIDCNVVVNHQVVLTEEEKTGARKLAIQQLQDEHYRSMKKKAEPKKSDTTQNTNELTLF